MLIGLTVIFFSPNTVFPLAHNKILSATTFYQENVSYKKLYLELHKLKKKIFFHEFPKNIYRFLFLQFIKIHL